MFTNHFNLGVNFTSLHGEKELQIHKDSNNMMFMQLCFFPKGKCKAQSHLLYLISVIFWVNPPQKMYRGSNTLLKPPESTTESLVGQQWVT